MNKIFSLLLGLFFVLGCSSPKNIPYFADLPDSTDTEVPQVVFVDPKIQADDILSITIQTADPTASSIVNQRTEGISALGASSATNIGQQVVTGFLVDKNGEVELPVLGSIKVAGLTTFEARKEIREKASRFFVNPSVQVRFANFKITVIGEVTRPASYTLPNEKVTILDALGLAGDLTIYGKRENVLLIRETANGKKMIRFDLNDSEMFSSPYYYLKQNDVIYVEPNKAKIASTDGARTRTFAILASVLSLLIVAVTRL